MCFNSYTKNLPPLFYDGVQLPLTDSFKYLGMVCDRNISLNTAADAALRPFTAGIFRIKSFIQEHDLIKRLHVYMWLPTYAIPDGMHASQVWATLFLQQGKERTILQKLAADGAEEDYEGQGYYNGLTDLAKRVRRTPVVDATLAPSHSFEGAGELAPQPFWPLAAGIGQQLQPPVAMILPLQIQPLHGASCASVV